MAGLNEGTGAEVPAEISMERSTDDTGAPVVRLTGELDLSNVDALRPEFDDVVAGRPDRLVIDLERLSFMDSSGIALLVELSQRVGEIEIARPSTMVRRVIEATGLADVLRMGS